MSNCLLIYNRPERITIVKYVSLYTHVPMHGNLVSN